MQIYVELGVLLAISKLKLLTLRNYFKKTVLQLQSTGNSSHIISFDQFLPGLQKWDEDLDIDDIESILS